ncbi:MAG: hypothetical protein PHY05_00200 [Methanothrix sp.]|nr:hypothetical protein [Methanothrix sp.]
MSTRPEDDSAASQDGPAHGRRTKERAVDPRRGCGMQAAGRG